MPPLLFHPSFSRNKPMAPCNYIPLDTAHIDSLSLYLDDLFDLDILCTEEGIFINAFSEE
jgi:hypothetical protein